MDSLRGQFLVAMPDMGDDRFKDTVIYVVGHSDEGAMGLVVNQPLEDVSFADIIEQLGVTSGKDAIRLPSTVRDREVLRGGPMQRGRGFVLHSPDYFHADNTLEVTDEVCLTATLDILKAMAFGKEPAEATFALGYCGWAPGQLENELGLNGWLTVPYSHDLLFGSPLGARYDMALGQLGITRATLSGAAGHA